MNFTGLEDNKAFKSAQINKEPFYSIKARLNLAGLESNDVYYFNKENTLTYMDARKTPYPDEYGQYYTIDDHSVIGEIMVCSNPDMEYAGDINDISFTVGGVYKPSISLTNPGMDPWGGLTGNSPGPISVNQLKVAQICYYGSSPLNDDHDPDLGSKKYLALKISDESDNVHMFTKGSIYITVKVYPKFQH
jgi:hypothetical protein